MGTKELTPEQVSGSIDFQKYGRSVKIFLIGPVYSYRGGIVHFTTSMGIELAKTGIEVEVVSFKRPIVHENELVFSQIASIN